MKRKIAAGIGALALAGAAVAITGGTYAYFNADSTTGVQNITAGTLTIALPGGSSGITPSINIGQMKPGDLYLQDDPNSGWYGASYKLTIANTGNIDGVIDQIQVVGDTAAPGSPNGTNLADRLQIRFVNGPDPTVPGTAVTPWQPLATATFNSLDTWGRIPGSGSVTTKDVYLQIQWPNGTPDQDNPYQGTGTQFRVKVTVRQADVGSAGS